MKKLDEYFYGKGAIKITGKIVLLKKGNLKIKGKKLSKILIAGVVIGEDLLTEFSKKTILEKINNSYEYEMWAGEIVFVPHRKYRGRKTDQEQFKGMRIDQVLRSNWGDEDAWLEKIFDKSERNE